MGVGSRCRLSLQPSTGKSEQRLEINSLKRRLLEYERVIREKTGQLTSVETRLLIQVDMSIFRKLTAGRDGARAAANIQKIEALEADRARLKRHLAER